MNTKNLTELLQSWTPVSAMFFSGFAFGLAVVGWYVYKDITPPAWITDLAFIAAGALNISLGGTLAATHAASVRRQYITEAQNAATSNSTPTTNTNS